MISEKRPIVFTNTYAAFLKYISFYNLERIMMNDRLCYSYVNDQLENIYNSGEHFYTKEYKNGRLESVLYQNMFFTFVIRGNVYILTDFCHPSEWQNENVLLGGPAASIDISENELYHIYHCPFDNKDYIVVNTYNAFYSFAEATGEAPNLGLNSYLFRNFSESYICCPFSDDLQEEEWQFQFKFVCIENVVILYDYVVPANPKAIAVAKPDIEMYGEDDPDEEECGAYTIEDLEEMGAFTDEGIYPSWF